MPDSLRFGQGACTRSGDRCMHRSGGRHMCRPPPRGERDGAPLGIVQPDAARAPRRSGRELRQSRARDRATPAGCSTRSTSCASSAGKKMRDVSVLAGDEAHIARDRRRGARSVAGVEVEHVSDRTFLLHLGGKIEMASKVPLKTRDDLSMAYTPGVARVCRAIADDPSRSGTSRSSATPSRSSPTAPRCSASATSAPRPRCR